MVGFPGVRICISVLVLLLIMPGFAVSEQSEQDGNEVLPERLHRFIEKRTGDYGEMKEQRLIRILVPYSRTYFFFDGATPRGLAYESIQAFEKYVNKLEKKRVTQIHAMIIPTAREDLFTLLQEGLGDIAVGNLTITPKRLELAQFSDPMLTGVRELIVTAGEHPPIEQIEDLAGKKVHVRKSSSYYEHLVSINKDFAARGIRRIRIVEVDDHLEDEDVLEMINAGMLERTVVDAHKAHFWAGIFDNILLHEQVDINSDGEIAWAIRKNNPELLKIVNGFVEKNKKGTLIGNVVFNKYLKEKKYITNSTSTVGYKRFNNLKPFFEKYAAKYDHDYLLLAALAYQESQLDQSRKSKAGAVGVMQLLPSTAKGKNVGIPDISNAENNIHAGAKYLRFLADTYVPQSDELDPFNRWMLTLASYNAGPSKIRQLRKKAEEEGYSPNEWFHNVEIVVAQNVGRETVQYVSNILKYYVGYKLLEEKIEAAHDPEE